MMSKEIFKHVINDNHLSTTDEFDTYVAYAGKVYSGIGFSDAIFTDILNRLIVYEGGVRCGINREWHKNGILKEEALEADMINGYRRKWDTDGNLVYEGIYINGLCIYERELNNQEKWEEIKYLDNTMICKELYDKGRLYGEKEVPRYLDKHFKDGEYIKDIFMIFERFTGDDLEETGESITDEIVKYTSQKNSYRDNEFCMYHRVVKEEELVLIGDTMIYDGNPYTGMLAGLLDDDELSSIVLTHFAGYKEGKKHGFEMVWEPEEKTNPEGLEKYGVTDGEYYWWSKSILKSLSFYDQGKLIYNDKL